jgi:hypothetical protein
MGKIKKFAEHSALSDTSWSVGKVKVTLRQLLKFMKENDITSKWIPISKLEKLLIKTKREKERLEEADLRFPIIVSRRDGKYTSIIDGHHRLEKSMIEDSGKIKAKILDFDDCTQKLKRIFFNK